MEEILHQLIHMANIPLFTGLHTRHTVFFVTQKHRYRWWIFHQWRPPSPQQKDVRLGRWFRWTKPTWQRPRFYGLLLFFWLSQVRNLCNKNMDAWCFLLKLELTWPPKTKSWRIGFLSPFLVWYKVQISPYFSISFWKPCFFSQMFFVKKKAEFYGFSALWMLFYPLEATCQVWPLFQDASGK